jgi:hypothetical protein
MEVVTQRHLEWTDHTLSALSDPSASQWHDEWNAFRSPTEQTLDVFPHSLNDESFGMIEHFNHDEQNPPKSFEDPLSETHQFLSSISYTRPCGLVSNNPAASIQSDHLPYHVRIYRRQR